MAESGRMHRKAEEEAARSLLNWAGSGDCPWCDCGGVDLSGPADGLAVLWDCGWCRWGGCVVCWLALPGLVGPRGWSGGQGPGAVVAGQAPADQVAQVERGG